MAEQPPVTSAAADAVAEVRDIAHSAEQKVLEIQAQAEDEARRLVAEARTRERQSREVLEVLLGRLDELEELIEQLTTSLKDAAQEAVETAQTAMQDILGSIGSSTAQLGGQATAKTGQLRDELGELRRRLAEYDDDEEPAPGVGPARDAEPGSNRERVREHVERGEAPRQAVTATRPAPAPRDNSRERAFLVARDMALSGSPRAAIVEHLRVRFDLPDLDEILDEAQQEQP